MVEDAAFDALVAGDADQAIAILTHRLDIRAVFTDIDMPGSMDGLKLAAAIRDRWPAIEFVVTSDQLRPADIPTRRVTFSKPCDPAKVVAAIRRMAA